MAQQPRYQEIADELRVLQQLLETRGREGTFVTKAHVPFVTRLSTDPKTGLGGGGEEGATYPNLVSEQGRKAGAGTLQTSYYPLEWVQRGAEGLLDPGDINEGAVEHLAKTIGLKQVGYRDLISARLPNEREQELFNLTQSHTVIEVYRTSFSEGLTPIRVTITVYPSDRNQLVYDAGIVSEHWDNPAYS